VLVVAEAAARPREAAEAAAAMAAMAAVGVEVMGEGKWAAEGAAAGAGVDADEGAPLALLTPTFSVRRPVLASQPFSCSLRPHRDAAWLAHTRSRSLTLPVHTSGAMLCYDSPTAALYHATLALYQRQYAKASALLGSLV
jgi:nitrogen fixation protein FixH